MTWDEIATEQNKLTSREKELEEETIKLLNSNSYTIDEIYDMIRSIKPCLLRWTLSERVVEMQRKEEK